LNYESRHMAGFEEGTILDQQQRQNLRMSGIDCFVAHVNIYLFVMILN